MNSIKLLIFFAFLLFLPNSSAMCTLTPSLINQDPVFAIPGETVKVLFQITGVENPECGVISLELMENYPFSLESGYPKIQTIIGGTYQRDFNSFWIIPYKLRVDSNALNGDQTIKLKTWLNGDSQLAKVINFNLSIEEVRTDFEITLDSYSFSTNKLVLGILNIGEKNAESITVEIPEQQTVLIEGGHIKILGALDSNEDTTATFDAVPNSGNIKINLNYNDETGERRFLTKEVLFSELAFENTRKKSTISLGQIILWLVVIGIVIYLFISRRKKAHHQAMQKFNR